MWFSKLLSSDFIQSLIKYGLLTLAAIGLVKSIRKDAADDKENEIKAENAEIAMKLLKEDKEREKNIDALPVDDQRKRLQAFFNKDK